MRTTRWSLLVAVSFLLAACSSDSVELVATEPPPATETPAPVEPEPAAAVAELPAVPAPAPVAEAPAAGPAADAAADAADDPVLEGTPRPVAATRGAPAPAPATGAVQAASARPSGARSSTGRIEIPAIGLNHATYEGIELSTIDNGPSHWPGTPLPGQKGNTVFPGHRTTHSRPFGDLDRLRPGNEVIFTTSQGRFTYRVTHTMIVGSRDTYVVNNTPDATFTLLACHPKGSARQRIVVKGTLVSAPVALPPPPPPRPPPPPAPPTPPRAKFLGIL